LAPGVDLQVIRIGGPKRKFVVYEDDIVLKQSRHKISLASVNSRPKWMEPSQRSHRRGVCRCRGAYCH
jgi:hypothetical protein